MVVHLGECDSLASAYVWCECPSFGFMYRPIVPTDSARVGVGGARRAVGVGGARRSRRGDGARARVERSRGLPVCLARAGAEADGNRVMTAATRRSAEPPSVAETTTTTRADVEKMTVATLRDELRARGLATDGLKAVLATRLREALDSPTRGTKRERNDGDGARVTAGEAGERKRRRWDDAEDGDAPGKEAPVKAKAKAGGLDKQVLLKQKQALLKQKELAAKLKARKEASGKGKAEEKSSARPSAKQMTLRLDAQGREIDESGALVVNKVIETSTLRMNLKQQRANAFAQAQAEAQAELASQIGAEHDDPSLRGGRARKPRANFQVRIIFPIPTSSSVFASVHLSKLRGNLTKCPLETTRML